MSALFTTDSGWLQSQPSAFPFVFVILWCSGLLVLSIFSGWFSLARKFRCENEFNGQKFRFCSAYMRFFSHYGSVLTFGANSSGLYISIFPLFRVGHPPLLIPWSEITVPKGDAGIIFKRRKFILGREESITLSISNILADDLRTAAGSAWPVESVSA